MEEKWHVFSTSLGRIAVDQASAGEVRIDDFCTLTGCREDHSDPDSADVCIQHLKSSLPLSAEEIFVSRGKKRNILYHREKKSFRILQDAASCIWVWKFALFCSCLASIFRRKNGLMMHGALLEMPDGGGVALCGPSGMGKSTTARRWLAAGGRCYADDFFWLVWRGDEIFAYPLPTWSRCEKSLQGEFFPVDHGIPLKALLALGRGKEKESIELIAPVQYQYAVYASAIFFEQEFIPSFPAADVNFFMDIVRENFRKLLAAFPTECLWATLDGDLLSTMGKFYE